MRPSVSSVKWAGSLTSVNVDKALLYNNNNINYYYVDYCYYYYYYY